MNEFDLIVRFKSNEDSITLRNYIIDHLFEDKLFDNLQMWDFKRSEVLSIVNLRKENAELKEQNELYKEMLERNPCVVTPDWHCSDCLEENAELKSKLEKEQNLNKVIKERLVEVNCDCNAEKKEKCVMFPEYCEGERKTVVDLMSLVSDGLNETLIKQKEEQIEVKKLEILELKEQNEKMKNFYNCAHSSRALCPNEHNCKGCKDWELPDD